MSGWRVILTDSETLSGVAPVCPQQTEPEGPHDIDRNEDDETARYDVMGVYDCCPGPHLECWSRSNAEDVRVRLDRVDAEVCT